MLFHLLRPTSLVRASFLVLATGIAGNALFLQGGPHPAPLFATREASFDDASSAPAVPVSHPVAPRDDLVLAVQAALREKGLYAGPLDGIAGPLTSAAITVFERASGREPTGAASLEILAELSAPEAGSAEGHDEPASPPAQPDPRLAIVQAALARAAYGPLPADGLFGPQTRSAIERFQLDHGLPVTGEYSEALVVELRAVGALEEE
jgi:peptidoglycan hydrolase-like protein with peptidoglycan-binding domain